MICRNHVDVTEGVRRCSRCGVGFCTDCLVMIQDLPYCADCKTEQLLDVRSGVDRTSLPLANVWKRFAAYIIDYFIIFIPFYGLFLAVLFLSRTPRGDPSPWAMLMLIPLLFAWPVYEGLMTHFRNGQTLGKMALDVRVVRVDGSPITPGQAWGRALAKYILGSCLSLINFIPAFFTNDRTAIHDLVVSTRVVEAR